MLLALLAVSFAPAALAQTPAAPPAPTGLSVQGSGSSAALTWTAVSGATTYNLYRANGQGSEGTTPYRLGLPGSATGYTDTGLPTAVITIWYQLTAVGPGGESLRSAEVQVTDVAPPASVTLHPGDTQITVSWPQVDHATGYHLFRSTTPGGEGATPYLTHIPNFTDFTDTGLTNGTTYYYQISSLTAHSESVRTAEFSAVPVLPPPLAPTSLNQALGNGQISLSWTASAGAATYNVYRAAAAGTESAPAVATGITGTSYIDTGLTNGNPYNHVVTAVNAGGESAFSNEIRGYPTGTCPVPTSLLAVPQNAQVTLSWNKVNSTVGYNVRRATSSSGPWGSPVFVAVASAPAPGYIDQNLTNGTTYYYQVTTVNTQGGGAESAAATTSATPNAPPPRRLWAWRLRARRAASA